MALFLIISFYLGIGVLAARGSIALTSKHFAPRIEQVLYGLLLIPIAAIYLAFVAHFTPTGSWGGELLPVVGFAVLGLIGTRFAPILMLGYLGHGAWDLAHEVLMFQGRLGTLTPIPLAYGTFCAAFDWIMVGYFWTRRDKWATAWQAG